MLGLHEIEKEVGAFLCLDVFVVIVESPLKLVVA
jgi:hypothetical protein